MSPARKLCAAACLTAVFLLTPLAAGQSQSIQDRITEYENKLAEARATHRNADEGVDLVVLGFLHRQAGEVQKALSCLNEALQIEQSANNKAGQALALSNIGRVYSDTGEDQKALELFQKALAIWESLAVKPGEALSFNSIAQSYKNLGEHVKSLDALDQAVLIWNHLGDRGNSKRMLSPKERLHNIGQWRALKELNDALPADVKEQLGREGEANTYDLLGQTHSTMGRGTEALNELNHALQLWQEAGQKSGEALTLNNMGRAYADLGQKQTALDAFNRALQIWRVLGNRQGEALTLDSIGRLYRDLGLQQSALDYYKQALPIFRETSTKAGEGLALNDIGRAYADVGKTQEAIEYSQQALSSWRECENLRGEAMTLNNMGRDYFDLGMVDKSLEFDMRALRLWRKVNDRRGESLAYMTIGWAQYQLKQWDQALVSELVALALAKQADDPEIEGGIETALMIGFRAQHHPAVAIFFGMEATTAFQKISKNISELDKDLQAGFAQSKSMTYRILAQLLIEAGRLGESEQIIDMLKEQELKDVVRGAPSTTEAKLVPVSFTSAQQKAQTEMAGLDRPVQAFDEKSVEAAGLDEKSSLSPSEDSRLKELSASIERGRIAILAGFAASVLVPLEQQTANSETVSDSSTQSYLQNTLSKLGPRAIGIRLFLGDNHAYEILVTGDRRKCVTLIATSSEIRSEAIQALKLLVSHNADPKPQLIKLYSMIVAPVEGDLKQIEDANRAAPEALTLLWSLDDAVRYLPMAALYDGHQFMLERFNNVLFTPESYGHMLDTPLSNSATTSVLAMGLSKSYGGLPALPGVLPELNSIVHDPSLPESHGPMSGKLLPDDQFTLASLQAELRSGNRFPIVHIASHFVVEAGNDGGPYLMLGGEDAGSDKGFPWHLSDMENSAIAFHGTKLLTLSACSTGKEYTSRNGIEMDSLGMVAQQKGAEAVLASLWDVNDASTSRLMSDFYSRWLKSPAEGKGEALRQAQLALLRNSEVTNARAQRGFEAASEDRTVPKPTNYSSPYYWAPFVLVGNYK